MLQVINPHSYYVFHTPALSVIVNGAREMLQTLEGLDKLFLRNVKSIVQTEFSSFVNFNTGSITHTKGQIPFIREYRACLGGQPYYILHTFLLSYVVEHNSMFVSATLFRAPKSLSEK